MTYDSIFQLVSVLAIISIATERAVEVITTTLNLKVRYSGKRTQMIITHLLSILTGGAIYAMNADQMIPLISTHFNQYTGPLVVGLLASGGSGFWHDLLGIVSAMKVNAKAGK